MSALCLLLSFFGQNRFSDFSSAASSLQGALQQRESLLDDYAFKALDIPEDEWIELKDLPEDMRNEASQWGDIYNRCLLCDFQKKGVPCPLINLLKSGRAVCEDYKYIIIKKKIYRED